MSLRARLSSLNRMRQVTQVMVRHGFGSVVDPLGFSDAALVDPQPDELGTARLGRRLALALTDLGPTFVKLGQLLATREDLLPAAVTTELAPLQDRVAPLPESAIRAEIARALGGPVEQFFALFGAEPLASASIAQVHRALTHRGQSVVVKVRRPGIGATVAEDLALLTAFAELLEERVEDARRFDPRGLARAFAEGLQRELDFRLEAEAYRRMRRAVLGTCELPAVLDALSGETVLTLEFIEGRKVTAVTDPAVREALAKQLLRTFTRQVLHAGYFHADPHPGNLLARAGSDALVLLDLGAVGTIDPETRATLIRLAAAGAARDPTAFGRALLAMADAPEPVDPAAWDRDVAELLTGLLAQSLRDVPLADIAGRIFALLRRHGLRIRGSYLTLVRAAALVDGVLRTLDPTLDPLRAAAPFILEATVAKRELAPAVSLARSLVVSRWRRDPTFRWSVVAAATTAALGAAVVLAWVVTR